MQGGGTKKNWVNEDVYEQFRDAAKGLRDRIDKVENADAIRRRGGPACRRNRPCKRSPWPPTWPSNTTREKRELGVLDFDDLLIHARDLLVGPERGELRKRLAGQIRLLLVDEFQDTDPLQVELVKALCDNEYLRGKLFFVGDYKQSIYRFRGADPSVFRRLRDEIPSAGRLPLSVNFRSQPAMLDFVNALFCEELGPDYEPLRSHRRRVSPTAGGRVSCGRTGRRATWAGGSANRAARVARIPSPLPSPLSPSTTWAGASGCSGSRPIGSRGASATCSIRGEKIVWDEEAAKAGRRRLAQVKPGDFALLFRALTNVEYYEEALRRYGIDYYLVGGHAFYAQQEIYDLLNLLRAIDIPGDEVSLLGVLRSPMFALHDETLFWLSRHPEGLAAGLFDGAICRRNSTTSSGNGPSSPRPCSAICGQ